MADPSFRSRAGRVVRHAPLLFLAAAMAAGCSSTMDIQVVSRPGIAAPAGRAAGCDIHFDERPTAAPAGCTEIADAWFGDTGYTVNCGWPRVSDEARRKGCELGADVAQVVWKEAPRFDRSTCFQIRVRYLSCVTAAGGAM
jgi:hypothetical protein